MNDEDIHPEYGPYYDFWLFREEDRSYSDYKDLLGRNDAPISLSNDVINYLHESLQWVPKASGRWVNSHGPTVFNQASGESLHNICAGWVQILSQGPETLILSYGWTQTSDEEGNLLDVRPFRFRISRDAFVADLEKLADYGRLLAAGGYFLFLIDISH